MAKDGFDNQWPGPDDRLVVTEMLANSASPHWKECRNFILKLIQASDLPVTLKADAEDAVQKIMLAVMKNLQKFRYECRLSTWLTVIVHNRVNDMYREWLRNSRWITQISNQSEKPDNEADQFELETRASPPTPEEICIKREELSEVFLGLEEYLNAHRHPERNRFILQKVLLENSTCEEIAKHLDISAAMVSYVVREARRYLREKMRLQSLADDIDKPEDVL